MVIFAAGGCKCWGGGVVIGLLGLCGAVRGVWGGVGYGVFGGVGLGGEFDIYFCVFFNCFCRGLVFWEGTGRWAMPPSEFEIFPIFLIV